MFEKKVIFLTGATGFVGKVILEKILRCFPNVQQVFILVRSRAPSGHTAQERCELAIKGSPIFQRLRRECAERGQDFGSYFDSKVSCVEGNLIADHLGMTPQCWDRVTSSCDLIISSAANVDFGERLDRLFRTNVTGSQNILKLAQACRKEAPLVHISTAYVNHPGVVEEKEVTLDFDGEQLYHDVFHMSPDELQEVQSHLYGYPNAYTLSKAVAEHMLSKNRQNVNVLVLRPSIIGAALREPERGWVDSSTAAASLCIAVGMGVIWFVPGNEDAIADNVPVDYVCNLVLAAGHLMAMDAEPAFKVVHCGTSDLNPGTWQEVGDGYYDYWRHRPPKQQVFLIPPWGSPEYIPSQVGFKRRFDLTYAVPRYAISLARRILPLSTKVDKKLRALEKMPDRIWKLCSLFGHFTTNQWIFRTEYLRHARQRLTPSQRHVLFMDIEAINWRDYHCSSSHGVHLNVLKDNTVNAYYPVYRKNTHRGGQDHWAMRLRQKLRKKRRHMLRSSL